MRKRLIALGVLGVVVIAALWFWRSSDPAASGGDGEESATRADQLKGPAGPAGWATLKESALPAARGTLSISGIVSGAKGPVAGAQVVVTEGDGDEILSERMCQCDDHCGNKLLECGCAEAARQLFELVAARIGEAQPIGRAVSGPAGTFEVGGLREGRYAIWATGSGESGVLAGVSAGTEDAKVSVAPGVRVSGRVVDEHDKPVAGAWVTGIFTASSRFFDVTSDAEGRFAIDALPSGPFRFVAAHPGLLPAATTLDEKRELLLKMETPRALRGVVRAHGQPVAKAKVELFGEHRRATALTGPDGRYALGALRSGEYSLKAAGPGGMARASVALDAPDTTLDLELGPSGSLSGRVVDEHDAAVAADVIVSADDAVVARLGSGSDGAFHVDELPAGTYRVHPRLEGKSGKTVTAEIEAGSSPSVVLHVFRGVALTGRVVDSESQPVPGVQIAVDHEGDEYRATNTDGDGGFSIAGVAPGTREWTARHSDFIEATGEVNAPGVLEIRLERGATITGDFVDEDGAPVEGEVWARSKAPSDSQSARTDSQGAFTLKGLKGGHYTVAGAGRAGGSASIESDVAPHGSARAHLALKPGVEINGMVVNTAGEPLANQQVYSSSIGKDTDHAVTRSDADGGFRLTHLRAGASYMLEVVTQDASSDVLPKPFKAPASGVRLTVDARPRVKGRVLDSNGNPLTRFVVNHRPTRAADGRFDVSVFVDPEEKETSVSISAEGLAPYKKKVAMPGPVVDLGDVVLTGGRSVVVTVKDASGKAVMGARVRVKSPVRSVEDTMEDDIPESVSSRMGIQSDITDASGQVRLKHVSVDAVEVKASREGLAPATASVGTDQNAVTLTLGAAGKVHGVLHDVDGGYALGDVDAELDGTETTVDTAARDGRFTLSGLQPGNWTLHGSLLNGLLTTPVKVEVQAGSDSQVDLYVRAGVSVTFQAASALDWVAWAMLVPDALGPINSDADLRPYFETGSPLNRVSESEWSSQQAAAGPATLLFMGRGRPAQYSAVQVMVPAGGGVLSLTVPPPRELPAAKR